MRAWLIGVVLVACVLGTPALGITVEKVPRPAAGAWSVDTTRTISAAALGEVDRLGTELDQSGQGQLAVVVVDTTGGRPSRAFALDLFNRWGIGHAGRDDGALLFIALKDRKAEIILGDGVDGSADQFRSDSLMSGSIVPAFKRGDANAAVTAGARGLAGLLQQSSLNSPTDSDVTMEAAPEPAAAYPPEETVSAPEPPRSTELGFGHLAGAAGALGVAGMAGRAWYRRRPRKCATCGCERFRLDERADDRHLDAGQRHEENIGSVDYDVWWCEPCEDALVERYGVFFTSFARCARCNYVTAKKTTRTIRSATYDHGGEVEVTLRCGHCDHVTTSRHSTPRRTRSSSSSSSSRSSSRSSFGGGRSAGGGSSGSW